MILHLSDQAKEITIQAIKEKTDSIRRLWTLKARKARQLKKIPTRPQIKSQKRWDTKYHWPNHLKVNNWPTRKRYGDIQTQCKTFLQITWKTFRYTTKRSTYMTWLLWTRRRNNTQWKMKTIQQKCQHNCLQKTFSKKHTLMSDPNIRTTHVCWLQNVFSKKIEFNYLSPSQQHYKVYKALLRASTSAIIVIYVVSKATMNGYTLQWWITIIDTMFEKSKDSTNKSTTEYIEDLQERNGNLRNMMTSSKTLPFQPLYVVTMTWREI